MISFIYNEDISESEKVEKWLENPASTSTQVMVNAHEDEREWKPVSPCYDYKEKISIKMKIQLKNDAAPKSFAEMHNNFGLGFDTNGNPIS